MANGVVAENAFLDWDFMYMSSLNKPLMSSKLELTALQLLQDTMF